MSAAVAAAAAAGAPRKRQRKETQVTAATTAEAGATATAPDRLPHTIGYHRFLPAELAPFRASLLAWYDVHRRRLPWRGDCVAEGSTAAASFGAAEKQQRARDKEKQESGLRKMIQGTKQQAAAESEASVAAATSSEAAAAAAPAGAGRDRQPVSAYGVWVSEIMLQQTRVETVLNYWSRWMARFPTLHELAEAAEDDVQRFWAGLGYYRRAKFLQQGAKAVVEKHGGIMPETVDGLLAIPGIGPYTAGAIASIAFGVRAPLVDGNVIRVLSRLRAIAIDPMSRAAQPIMWALADRLVDPARPGDFNQALMEHGATVCTPLNPRCDECPVRSFCYAFRELQEQKRPCTLTAEAQTEPAAAPAAREVIDIEDAASVPPAASLPTQGKVKAKPKRPAPLDPFACPQERCSICEPRSEPPATVTAYPSKASKTAPLEQRVAVVVVKRLSDDGRELYLLLRRPAEGLLAGKWEFPSVIVTPEVDAPQQLSAVTDFLAAQFCVDAPLLSTALTQPTPLGSLVHIFSHRKHLMDVQAVQLQLPADSTLQHVAADRVLEEKSNASKAAGSTTQKQSKGRKRTANGEEDADADEAEAETLESDNAESLPQPRSYRWVSLATLQEDHHAEDGSELGLSTGVRKVVKLITEAKTQRALVPVKRKKPSAVAPAEEGKEQKEGPDESALDDDVVLLDEPAPKASASKKKAAAPSSASKTRKSAAPVAVAAKSQPSLRTFFASAGATAKAAKQAEQPHHG